MSNRKSKKQQRIEAEAKAKAEAAQIEAQQAEGAEASDVGEEPKKKTMAAQLRAARPRYVPTTTASGNKSLRCTDAVAELLEGRDVNAVYTIVEGKLNLAPGSLRAKYENLNVGQKRMNAGNLLRNAVKRGEVTV